MSTTKTTTDSDVPPTAKERGYYKVSLKADIDKNYLIGEDRTKAQKDHLDDIGSHKSDYETWELVWDLNRINRLVDGAPTEEDITRLSEYSSSPYYTHFGSIRTARQAANLSFDVDHPNHKEIPQWELAWELNRLDHELNRIPTTKDIATHSCYGRTVYKNRFDNFTDARRKANIKLPRDHLIDAIKSYVKAGNSYATTKNLKEHMYPHYDTSDYSGDFGVRETHLNSVDSPQTYAMDIIESWEYPKISSIRIGHILGELSRMDGPYNGVEVEIWSDSQVTTYRFEVHNE